MKNTRSLPLCALASAILCSLPALAQQVAPAVRIVNSINENQRITLTHTVNPLANAANDRGPAPDGMLLDRIQLVLQRSPAQESALHQLIAEQNTPGSPNYHQWLTPQQFGAQFGASDQDIATVESWLGAHGFTVSHVNPGKGTLEFSGSVAQLRDTFHTQIHKYVVDGESHFANANDPQVPAAIAPVIAGFTSLNNFRPHPYLQKLGEAAFNPTTHQVKPSWTWGTSSSEYFVMAPADYALQYDLQPLYTAGVNGSGQTIAIINESNINIDLVNQFRSLFNLPVNPPQIVIDGNDPGVDGVNNPDGPNFASTEAYLDVEWAGAVAPNAQVDLVIAADTSIEQGLVLAMERAIYSNIAPVVSISFGNCESSLGASNAFVNSLWEQGAAQGQTIMVSSGDNGSAGCDNDNSSEYAVGGQAVNGFASTPYNVAVGGTDFYYSQYNAGQSALNTQLATYWNVAPTQLPAVSLLQVVPEQPWNNSQYGLNAYNQYASNGSTTIAAASGGASNAAICAAGYNSSTGACNGSLSGYPKPAWQAGTGVPADGVRDLPDVSLFAANGSNYSFYPMCATDGDCQTSGLGANGLVQIYGVGGTSASAPAFAAIMALVNQYMTQKLGSPQRQGQADNTLYALKTQFPAAFHDVTHGTISVPCEYAPTKSPNCISVASPAIVNGITEGQIGTGTTAEYNAAAGYNLATGLGTVDANVLVTDWNKVTAPATTSVTLTASPTTFTHGAAVNISGTVTGSSPTGNVALMTDSTEPLQQGQATLPLSSGAYSNSSLKTLPGGTYHIWAQYGGDAHNSMSTSSPPILLTVSPETPGMNFNLFNAALGNYYTSSSNPGTQVDFGTQLVLSAEVAPTSQLSNLQNCVLSGTGCSSLSYTQPTGTVTFKDNSTAINTAVMNAEGDAEYNAPWGVGSHSVTAVYNGDQSYNAYTSPSPIAFTVVKDNPVFFWAASNTTSSSQIITGQPTVFNVIVENGAQYNALVATNNSAIAPVSVAPPTGTVTLTSNPAGISGTITLSSGVDPATSAQAGIGTLTLASGLAAGSYSVGFVYSGDNNYVGNPGNPATGTIQVISTSGLASTTTANMTGAISPNGTITVTGTVTGQSGHSAPTGAIIFFSSGYNLGSVAITAGSGTTSTFSAVLSSQDLFQGANFITLQYTGDTTYAPSEFNLSSGGAIANPLADFTLVPNTTLVPVSISGGANSGTDTINVASVNGFAGTVNLTCSATSPLTCSFNSPNPAISNGTGAAPTLTINVPSGATNGNYNVLVTGKDANTGAYIHTLSITADVSGASTAPAFSLSNGGAITVVQGATTGNTSSITVTPTNGYTGTVNLTCSVTTIPTGAISPVTCSVTPTVNVTSASPVAASVTANSTATTTAGAYAITVTGKDSSNSSITSTTVVGVTINLPQDFAITNSGAITVNAGATTGNTSTITVTPSGGLTGTVNLSCSVTTTPPSPTSPVTCNIPSSITLPGTTTATLTANSTSTTTIGGYVITVTGTAGAAQHSTAVTVTVNAAATPTFKLSNGGNISVSRGAVAGNTSTVTVTSQNGFSGTVNLSCAISPTAANDPATCNLASPSVSVSSTTTPTDVVTIGTTAATAMNSPVKLFWPTAGGGAVLAVLVFFGIPARRRSWRNMLAILIALVALGALSSCGGKSNGGGGGGNPGTTPGTYTVTVTGTSGNITQTTTITLTVL